MTRPVERRFRVSPSPEVRAAAAVGGGPTATIAGYAAVFDSPSEDLGFIETIDSGAFAKTLAEADVRGLANHDPDWLLGRTKTGTLRLSVDGVGLAYEIDVNPADPDGVRAIEKVRRGEMDGSSFSFTTIRDQWDFQVTPPTRRLLEVALIDVGPVTFPAYSAATAEARSVLDRARLRSAPKEVQAQRELELLGLRAGTTNSLGSFAHERRSEGIPASVGDLARRVQLVGLEVRVGKTISAATAQVLLDIVEKLEALLVADGAVEPADAA